MQFSRVLNVVGCHAEGEVGNVVTGGIGDVPGETMFEKMQHLATERDGIRRLLLHEPRGSVARSVNVLLPATDPAADMGYVIMESTEYPVMSGSNTICVATVLLETGMVPMREPTTELTLESPAGLITVVCECEAGRARNVRFVNQPSFVYHLGAPVEVTGIGTVAVDVAWGGMAYVLADAAGLGFAVTPDEARELSALGEAIKTAAREQLAAVHPENDRFAGVTVAELTMPARRREDGTLVARNTVVVSPGRLDRSPCGTGTSARLAVMHARGEIAPGETFVHESIIGSRFEARIESLARVGSYPAVVPSVAGRGFITGFSVVGLDPLDPFPEGYTLSDTWPEPA